MSSCTLQGSSSILSAKSNDLLDKQNNEKLKGSVFFYTFLVCVLNSLFFDIKKKVKKLIYILSRKKIYLFFEKTSGVGLYFGKWMTLEMVHMVKICLKAKEDLYIFVGPKLKQIKQRGLI